jgi:hypothetical protein
MSKLAAALVAVLLTLAGAKVRAESPRIAVKAIDGAADTAALRERMTRSMSEGLAASGAVVVSAVPVPASVDYFFQGVLTVAGRTYDWRIELLDGKSGAPLEARADRCEICTEDEALEMAGISASTLKVQLFKARTTPARPGLEPPAATTLVSAAPAATAGGHRSLGWVGVGAGVVAAAAGAWLLAIDGSGTCGRDGAQCPNVRDTKAAGWGAIAGGAAALTVGLLVLTGTF